MSSLWKLVGSAIPDDDASQVSAYDLARSEMARPGAPGLVLDLGCGDAASAGVFRSVAPDVRWVGLDVAESDLARAVRAEHVLLYDGEHFPLATGTIPLVYSRQVFEHVRYPEQVLAEVARVLTPGGVFIGSTSHLEPYHAYSLWNYTPYGFKVLVEAAGLELVELRPGPDGQALIARTYQGKLPEHGRWFTQESPLNVEIDEWGRATGRRPALVSNRKLAVCGQFCFRVRKPANWRPARRQEPSWTSVRSDGRRVLRDAVQVAAVAIDRASRRSPRLRAVVKRIPGSEPVVRAVRGRDDGRARR
ncbi:MAG TPA: class I SAM-dependent methyltransferase [Kineosporiaceae bacterium]|nr:class I SAM-dependent methyltransferase [Kineosporiaceae bacterium]